MHEPWITVVTVFLVSLAVLADVNLMQVFFRDWCLARREEQRRWLPVEPRTRETAPRRRQGRRVMRGPAIGAAVLALASGVARSASPDLAGPAPDVSSGRTGELPLRSPNMSFALQPSDSTPAEAASLTVSPDRPSFTDGCAFVPPWHLSLETGYTFTFRDRDDAQTQRHNAPEILARVGLVDDRFEFRLFTPGYVWSRTDSGAGFESTEGFSDAALGFKLKLLDQDGAVPKVCLEGLSTLGAGSRNVSSRKMEPTVKFLWSYDLHNNLVISGNFNLAFPTTDGDRFTQGQASLNIAWAATDRASFYGEYYVVGPNSKGSDAAHYADVGAGYLLTKRILIDGRIGFGLNQEADNFFTGVGISFLF